MCTMPASDPKTVLNASNFPPTRSFGFVTGRKLTMVSGTPRTANRYSSQAIRLDASNGIWNNLLEDLKFVNDLVQQEVATWP